MKLVKYLWGIRALCYKVVFEKIGNRCYMGRPLYVEGERNISIGNRTRIFPGLRIEALKNGKIEIGNNTVIEQDVHIISMRDTLSIGNNVTIAPRVFITNVNHEYRDIELSVMDQGYICKHTEIGEGCFIGVGAAIQAGTTLGKHCIVDSNAVVKGIFEDFCVISGNPARVIKKYDENKQSWNKCENR